MAGPCDATKVRLHLFPGLIASGFTIEGSGIPEIPLWIREKLQAGPGMIRDQSLEQIYARPGGFTLRNTSQHLSQNRRRLGGSNVIRHIGKNPSGVLGGGGRRAPISILSAVGYDVHVSTDAALEIGQRVTVLWGLSDADLGVAIPGIVHWLGVGRSGTEAGIVLQEKFPEEHSVTSPGCPRGSIRYACRVSGLLEWKADCERSIPAVVMNYSREGLCFQVAVAPPVEASVRFSWQVAGKASILEGMVRWTIGQEGGFLSGCELVGNHGYRISGIYA